jgi:hypothetical protein
MVHSILRQFGFILGSAIACSPARPHESLGSSSSGDGATSGAPTSTDGSPSTADATSTTTVVDSTAITSASSDDDSTSPSTASTSSSTTESTGCSGAKENEDKCDVHENAAECVTPCRWFDSRLFRDCGGECADAVPSGVCVLMNDAPETGCTGPCAKFWMETPLGLQLFEADLCFEFPDAWSWCQLNNRAECDCGCMTPP